jgi:hypothetical protein
LQIRENPFAIIDMSGVEIPVMQAPAHQSRRYTIGGKLSIAVVCGAVGIV